MEFWTVFPLILLFLLFFLKIPVAYSMLITGAVYYLFSPNSMDIVLMCQKLVASNSSFVYLAIPFFTCAGVVFNYSGITRRLMNLAEMLVGHLRGGLGHVNIVLSAMMGGLSGSAIADTAMQSKMLVPEMERLGYDKDYSCVVTAPSSCITPIIPPGICLILYSTAANVSVAKMFYAGYIPGLCIMAGLMILNWRISKKRGYKPSREKMATPREFGKALREAIWALFVPFGIVMALRLGICTPTEAGAMCILYSVVIGAFVYRELELSMLKDILVESVTATAGVMFILAGANVLNGYLTWERIPIMISQALTAGISSKYVFLLVVNVMLLAIGCFFDGGAAMILLAPLLVPVAEVLGIDLVHFGIVMCINLTIAGFTPPFGSQMFTTCAITGCSIEKYAKQAIPFVAVLVAVLLLLTYIPGIVLLVPNLLA